MAIDAILDGEIVTLQNGRPSFERLQSRINLHNERDIERASKSTPALFMAFDLLYLDGKSLIDLPLEERKEQLEALIIPNEAVQVSPSMPEEGTALYDAACQQKLEGIVAKKLGLPYRPGKRVRDWIKIKTTFTGDVVIGAGRTARAHAPAASGSLLVGAFRDGELHFVGSVGTGFSDRVLSEVLDRTRGVANRRLPVRDRPSQARTREPLQQDDPGTQVGPPRTGSEGRVP